MACDNCAPCGQKVSAELAKRVVLTCDLSKGADCPNGEWSIEIVCDSAGNTLYVATLFCDGAPKAGSTPSFFDLTGAAVTPTLPLRDCGANSDYEQHILCDTAVDPPKPFISRVAFNTDGNIIPDLTGMFELDGTTPYTPTGPVTVCGGDAVDTEFNGPLCEKDAAGNTVGYVWHKIFHRGTAQTATMLSGYKLAAPQTWLNPYSIGAGNTLAACDSKSPQTVALCDLQTDGSSVQFLRHYCLDCATGTARDTGLDGLAAYAVTGTVGLCTSSNRIDIVCRCDDTDGDGVAETAFKQIISISPSGVVTVLANYNQSMSAQYTPVAPGDCAIPGDNLIYTTPRYKVLTGAGTWVLNADSVAPTQSVTFMVIAVGSAATPPTVTDAGGTNPLFQDQSVSWSVVHNRDVAGLKTPLTLTTNAGDTVAVAWAGEAT